MITRSLLVLFTILFSFLVEATHIRGGQLIYRQVSDNAFEITFIGYRDTDGVLFGNGVLDFGDGVTFGGEGGQPIPWEEPEILIDGVEEWTFEVLHTYQGNGAYEVSYTEDFRNGNIQNIDASSSNPFSVSALIIVDPLIGPNSSPRFNTPDFLWFVDSEYLTSFNVEDPDGDVLKYNFITPRQANNLDVAGYRSLNNRDFYEGNSGGVQLNRQIGNLVWNTSGLVNIEDGRGGEFSIAISIDQWRDGFFIGRTVLDYSIEIWNLPEIGEEEKTRIILPEARCYLPEEETLQDVIVVENIVPGTVEVQFFANDSGYRIDGLEVADWNTENASIFTNEPRLEIPVQFSPSNSISGQFASLTMTLTYNRDDIPSNPQSSALRISQSQTMYYSDDCDFLNALGTQPKKLPEIKVELDRVSILSGSDYRTVIITDLSGKLLLREVIAEERSFAYSFKENKIYLITLFSEEESYSQKFIIKR